jgi:ADP-ribose pyrophosphatase YjhB (NUDIX family)
MIEARILFRARSGRVLLLQRADGRWDFPGDEVRDGETAEVAALRGALADTAYRCGHVGSLHCRSLHGPDIMATYLHDCDEFTPALSERHTAHMWIEPGKVLAS